jgi:hypothetical protein
MAATVETLARQAEHIGDSLLESSIAIVFDPTVENCDALIAACNGGVSYARLLRTSLLNQQAQAA